MEDIKKTVGAVSDVLNTIDGMPNSAQVCILVSLMFKMAFPKEQANQVECNSWKELHLHTLERLYGELAKEWADAKLLETDPRKALVDGYHEIVEALETLPDNPVIGICNAMNFYISHVVDRMDRIKAIVNGQGNALERKMPEEEKA